VERIEFTEEFFKINFQEPSLKELKQIANKIGENYEGDRKDLMKRLEERRNFVNQQAHEVVKIIYNLSVLLYHMDITL
jgi:hypothetical protein